MMDNIEDTIDFFDFIIIIIKRRRFILTAFSIILLLTGIWFAFVPVIIYSGYEKSISTVENEKIENVSSDHVYIDKVELSLNEELDWCIYKLYAPNDERRSKLLFNQWLLDSITEPETIRDSLKSNDYSITSVKGHLTDKINDMNVEDFINKSWYFNASISSKKNIVIQYVYTYEAYDELKGSIESLVSKINQIVTEKIASVMRSEINIWEDVQMKDIPFGILSQIYLSSQILSGKDTPLIIVSKDLQNAERRDYITLENLRIRYLKKSAIIIIVTFILTVLAAIFLEFITNFRKDDEKMKKIKDALK